MGWRSKTKLPVLFQPPQLCQQVEAQRASPAFRGVKLVGDGEGVQGVQGVQQSKLGNLELVDLDDW
jgi:hypothetical protein